MSDSLFRLVLKISALFNLGAGMAFAYPAIVSPFAEIAKPSALYGSISAYIIILFGACYFWLSRQPVINREMVAFGALGKIGAFLLFAILWTMGEAPAFIAICGVGDLILASLFLYWLRATRA